MLVTESQFYLDQNQCIACAICADICPKQALKMGPQDLLPTWTAMLCNLCTLCQQECPTQAIRVKKQ